MTGITSLATVDGQLPSFRVTTGELVLLTRLAMNMAVGLVSKLPYNTTDLSPDVTLARHVYHRDQFAHVLRWSHMAREFRRRLKERPTVLDFGCGTADLYELAYRNRTAPAGYIGLDIRESVIRRNRERFDKVDVGFFVQDLCNPTMDYTQLRADMVCSFEVIEHVGKQRAQTFLRNFAACGREGATYYLSTPNYDERVGAAGNHTYDAGDERGVAVQEFSEEELWRELGEAGFTIWQRFGTFASKRDYVRYLESDPAAKEIYERLERYYDSELTAVFMAPLVPAHLARNILWILKSGDNV